METKFFQSVNDTEKFRAAEIFREQQSSVYRQTDRIFAILLPIQWLASVAAAYFLTPLTWSGEQSSVHPHVWFAVVVGGAITSLPLFLTVFRPGEAMTRYVVAVSQMLMSGLLVHVSGGRVETHFHIFGSLAFLACYRDWRVLIPATIITALDHYFRGWLYPFSIYGTVNDVEWRWLEHAGWVIFTDIFLIVSCLRSVAEMREIAATTAAINMSEERYRTIIEQMTESIFLLEPKELKVIECNEAFANLLGCKNIEEAKTLYASDFDALNQREVQQMTEFLRSEGKSMSAERKYLRRDGSWINVEITGRYITYNNTNVFCVNARDITERKKAQIELKRLALVAEKTQNAVVISDTDGKITWVNEGFTRITGYTPDEVLGHKPGKFLQGEKTCRETIAAIHDAIVKREPFEGEIYNYSKNGNGYWLSISIMPITSSKGELKGFIAVEMDITERKEMEKQLQLSYENLEVRINERTAELVKANKTMRLEVVERMRAEEAVQNSHDYLEQIINAVGDPIFVKNRQHQFTLINDTMCEFMGRSREELIGKSKSDFFPAEEVAVFWEKDEVVFTSKKENINEEQFTNSHGEKRVIVTRKRFHVDKHGEEFIVGVIRDVTADKQVEEVLKASETMQRQVAERQTSILNALPAHICLLDQTGKILEVNNEWKQFAIGNGYSGTNFGVGSNYIGTCDTANGDCGKDAKLIADNCRAILSGESSNFEMEYPCDSPTERRWFKLTVNALDKKNLAGAVVMHINITERKMAEEAIKLSEAKYRNILETMAEGYFETDLKGNFTFFNDALCSIIGYNPAQVLGMNYRDYVDRGNGKKLFASLVKIFKTGQPVNNLDWEITRQDETQKFVESSMSLIRNAAAEPIGFRGLVHDVTERHHAEKEINETKQFLHTVINNVPSLIFVKDIEGNFVLVNQALADMFGTTPENLIGKTDADFSHNIEEAKKFTEEDIKTLQNLEEKSIPEEPHTDANGNVHWFQTIKRSVLFEESGARYLIGVATDFTERKIMESQLRHSQKMESIGQLAAGIAHEINTPTQYVGDNTRFIRDAFGDFSSVFTKYGELLDAAQAGEIKSELVLDIKDEIEAADFEYLLEEVPNAIQQSLEGVSRIAKIVQSMKDFAHPGSREKQSADLNRAIESTVTVARNEWKYVAEVETNFDKNLPLVPCYLGEFNQVVLNMVINAAHAISDVVGDGSNTKGKITITTTKVNNDWAEVRIGDTGNGIPPEIGGKIFDPFFTTKEVGKGTGQGLAISHTVVVDKHHGQLDFETETGHGTTFIIRLPLDKNQNIQPNESVQYD